MYDPDKLLKASLRILTDFEPDMDQKPFSLRFLGPLLDALDFKQLSGHGLSTDHAYRFVEGEYMTADEYDHFLLDPADFMVRNYWPRVFGASKGFAKLPPLHSIISYYLGMPTGFSAFSLPEVARTLALSRKHEREKPLACPDHLLRPAVHVDHKSLRASKEVAKRVEGSLAQPPICKGKPASCAFSEYGPL